LGIKQPSRFSLACQFRVRFTKHIWRKILLVEDLMGLASIYMEKKIG
jgi:hypothetical protein